MHLESFWPLYQVEEFDNLLETLKLDSKSVVKSFERSPYLCFTNDLSRVLK